MSAATLKLGHVDGSAQADHLNRYFQPYHTDFPHKNLFRGEKLLEWVDFNQIPGQDVKDLQQFFRDAGFQPVGDINGIFGYRTIAAARLFQEYVRTIEKDTSIGKPDGVVGPKSRQHIDRWRQQGKQADWVNINRTNASPEFKTWISLLNKVKQHYLSHPDKTTELVNQYAGPSDTVKVKDWDFDPQKIHLIGIRRKEWERTQRRANDDVFVLLINGLVFKFFGSTDPSQHMASRPDEPYIVRGQHRYRFGWHKLSDMKKVYLAFKPATRGVLVFRDVNNDNALTAEDIQRGVQPNPTVNIHWSGNSTSNWSAGCQVLCGKSYINHHDEVIDCTPFSANSYGELGPKCKGAYSIAADLITIFAHQGEQAALYTLLKEEDLKLEPSMGEKYPEKVLNRLLSV
jgi:hypothetical protein